MGFYPWWILEDSYMGCSARSTWILIASPFFISHSWAGWWLNGYVSTNPSEKYGQRLLPRNLTWNLKMMVSNRNLLFQGVIFRCYVSFREGRSSSPTKSGWRLKTYSIWVATTYSRSALSLNPQDSRGWTPAKYHGYHSQGYIRPWFIDSYCWWLKSCTTLDV